MKIAIGIIIGCVVGASVSARAGALSGSYRFTGKVVRQDASRVVLKQGDREMEFDLSGANPQRTTWKPGDELTLQYRLEVEKIEAPSRDSRNPQEPGEAAPARMPAPPLPAVLDDRAFYDARNVAAPDVCLGARPSCPV